MVLESVVVDLLNRVLGSYVENLDASQLKIGIFGGDVNLKDLIIKPSALDDLNVPFRVVYGSISKLTLKLPWSNLYGAPVIASVDGLYAVVVPSSGTKYDAAKERKAALESKQRALERTEEMKAKADLKNQTKDSNQDTFVGKLVNQILKNVQVNISNIHIRYEDNFTNPARPFSFGVTLHKLSFETVDSQWKATIVDQKEHIFNKLISLDSFAFYWNSRVRLISHLSQREIKSELVNTIAAEGFKPAGIGYMLGPITSEARMTINQKPELDDYKMPMTTVNILIKDISIGMAKCQYHDIMALIDSMNRMWLADKFRKYRPEIALKGHAKQWWRFAYQAILEEQVRPRRRQWNKDYILGHIRKVKEYRDEYKEKLKTKKESLRLKALEEELDLFNIVLARRQAEFEVEKLPKQEPKKGWFGGWWGGNSNKQDGGNEIVSKLAKEFTPDEKAKLYAAIDYNENMVPPEYPMYFVDKKINFTLETLNVSISDDSRRTTTVETGSGERVNRRCAESDAFSEYSDETYGEAEYQKDNPGDPAPEADIFRDNFIKTNHRVMRTTLNGVSSSVEMRPKGDALKVAAKIEAFKIESFPEDPAACRTLLTSDNNTVFKCRRCRSRVRCEKKMDLSRDQLTKLRRYYECTLCSYVEKDPPEGVEDEFLTASSENEGLDPVEELLLCKSLGKQLFSKHLLDVTFETNPLEGGCDQKIRVFAEPVEMFYDLRSFDAVMDVFKPPDTVSIDNIQSTAASSFKSLKVMSATGLQHAIDNKPSLDLLAEVKPSYILIYEGGKIDDTKNVLVLSMGQLVVKSKPRNKDAPTVQDMVKAGSSEKEVLAAMFQEAYDKMEIHLSAAELLVVPPELLWRDCVRTGTESTHILQPTDLYVNIDICFLPDEKRIPKVKVSGKLPSLEVSLSDIKLVSLMKIVQSMSGDPKATPTTQAITKAPGQSTAVEEAPIVAFPAQSQTVVKDMDAQNVTIVPQEGNADVKKSEDIYEEILVDLNFEVTKFLIRVQEVRGTEKEHVPLLEFETNELRLFTVVHPLDMWAEVTLKATKLTHLSYTLPDSSTPLPVLESNVDPGTGYMLKITYQNAEPKHPQFRTKFNNTLQNVRCHVGEMVFALHQQAIVSLISFSNKLTECLGTATGAAPAPPQPATPQQNIVPSQTLPTAQSLPSGNVPAKRPTAAPSKRVPVVQFAAQATLTALKVVLCKTGRFIAHMDITGMEASVEQTRRRMISSVKLRSISMDDPQSNTLHPNIIAITGDDVLNMKICQYEESGEEGYTNMEKVDMSVDATIGRMHFVFLWQFYLDIMSFLDSFQAAKDKVAEASAAAAAAAKVGMELAYSKAYKMALNVTINAPVIYVPQSSKSRNTVVMDFGVLSISNSFQPGPAVPDAAVPILYENTKISIDNLMMSRYKMQMKSQEPDQNSEFSIMEPVSFGLDIQRNLTAGAHKDLPELKMKGTIKSVTMKLGEDDYFAIMRILSENFEERPPGYVEPQEQAVVPVPSSTTTGQPVNKEKLISVETHTKEDVPDVSSNVRMEIFFTLEQIQLQLFSRRNKKKCEGLCALDISGFRLCGNFNHNNSFWVNMFLLNLTLDDNRPSRHNGIRRLITKTEDKEKMIDIIYQAEATGAFAAIVQVSRMRFVYSATLNLALLDFVNMTNMNKEENIEKLNQVKTEQATAALKIPSDKTVTGSGSSPNTIPKPVEKKVVPFTVILQIHEPDILLVADLENPESSCIIFKSSVNIRVKQSVELMKTFVNLENIEMFVSCLDKAQTCGVRSEILRRCHIKCDMTQTDTSQDIKVNITPLEIHMTPSAVEVVSSSLGALGGDTVKDGVEAPLEYFDPRKIWMPQSLQEVVNLWYVKKDAATAFNELEQAQEASETKGVEGVVMKQTASFIMESMIVTIEQGSGAQTMPMLLVNASLKGEASDWGSALRLNSLLNLVVFYYNERYAVWEPLLESVEVLSGGRKPWELMMTVEAAAADLQPEPNVPACQLPALYKVNVSCNESLELTVTKTALQVLQALGQEFSQALQKDVVDSKKIETPYSVENALGIPFQVNVEASNFFIVSTENDYATVEDGKKLHLDFRTKTGINALFADKTNLDEVNQTRDDDMFFNVRMSFGNIDADRKLNVNHTAKRVFRVPFRSYPGDDWSFVVDVSSHYGSRLVTLYSIVEVFNSFSVPMEVYYKVKDELRLCTCIEANSSKHLPLVALYTCTNELFFKPAGPKYQLSEDPFVWKTIGSVSKEKALVCKSTGERASFFMHVTGDMEEVTYDDSPNEKCKIYKVRLNPTVLVNNLLPVKVDVQLQESNVTFELSPGEGVELWNAKVSNTHLQVRLEYNGRKYLSENKLDDKMEELTPMTFIDSQDNNNTLDLGVHCEIKNSTQVLSLHCPFWMVNMTQTDIQYKKGKRSKGDGKSKSKNSLESRESGHCCSCFRKQSISQNEADNSVISHPESYKEPVLFTFGSKHMFAPKKKVSVKIFDSDWSEKISLDAVGQSGTIVAKAGDRTYALSVNISLSSTSLTRIVTFSPFYMVMNNSKFGAVEIRENNPQIKSEWIRVEKGQCVPVWPHSVAKVELLCRYAGTTEETIPFSFKESNSVLLKLENKFAGIFMTCQVEDSAAVVSFSEYEEGLSTVYLVNDTDVNICFKQEYSEASSSCLRPQTCMHYVWQDPRENRQLVCWVVENDICKVGPLTAKALIAKIIEEQTNASKGRDPQVIRWLQRRNISFAPAVSNVSLILTKRCKERRKRRKRKRKNWLARRNLAKELRNNLDPEIEALDETENLFKEFDSYHMQSMFPRWYRYHIGVIHLQDGCGIIDMPEKTKLYWVSFLDGKQRVLLFTKNGSQVEGIEKVGSIERTLYEFQLEFHGLGISLVDDDPFRREILYTSVTGSGAQWESRNKSKSRFKTMNPDMNNLMEAEYQKYLNQAKSVGCSISAAKVGKYSVRFGDMEITHPEPKIIKRNIRPGIWMHVKMTENQKTVHLKVHRIQIDDQIRDCTFPVVLSPVIMKRHVGEQKMAKPFIEMSVIMRQFQSSQLRQIKYCKLLMQEFAIRVDMCFVNSLLAFLTLSEKQTGYNELVERDLKLAATSLRELASQHAVQGQRDYIDYLHLSPMKIHLSFSMYAGGSAPPPPAGAFSGIKLLLQSFGVTLTDIQGAILKLDYFERQHSFLTMSQLTTDVVSHYTKQTLKQIYVVIFGLDVIGNPVGLLMGISTGVGDLFYEPLQGAIEGPEEFVAGLAQGVASLIGHTVGGAADAVGKITGALGKGVAALTMDEDYQRKRRLERNKRPQDLTEGIAQSGKDLVMGFYDGVTGIVTKPIEGARDEGMSGFVKGFGKGLIGVVARPASGVVDFASGTLASVKRATELEDVAMPVRPPRLIRSDGIVGPYNKMEAEGHQLLQEVENGKYAATDSYVTHLSVCSDGKNFVILTSQRVLFVEKGDIFGHWNCEWNYTWDQVRPPQVVPEGVKILLKEPKKKGLFHAKESGKIINISDPQICEWLCQQMNRAMSKNT